MKTMIDGPRRTKTLVRIARGGGLAAALLCAGCSSGQDPSRQDVPTIAAVPKVHVLFNSGYTAKGPDKTTGHQWLVYRAMTELDKRNLLPAQMTDPNAQKWVYYGADFADHPWLGQPDTPTAPVMNSDTLRLVDPNDPSQRPSFPSYSNGASIWFNAPKDIGSPVAVANCNDVDPNAGRRCNAYQEGWFSGSVPGVTLSVQVGARVGLGNGANGYPNIDGNTTTCFLLSAENQNTKTQSMLLNKGWLDFPQLEMNAPEKTNVAALFRTTIGLHYDLVGFGGDKSPIVKDFALDNLFHYALSDLSKFATPGTDPSIGTSIITYPLLARDIEDAPVASDLVKSWLISNMQYQPVVGGTNYGAPTYGAILYQLSRKFFVGSPSAPSIGELQWAGNDVGGWHTGGMFGNQPLKSVQLYFPHTYLGGNPFICAPRGDGAPFDYRDPCANGDATWPIWVVPPTAGGPCTTPASCGPAYFDALKNPTPPRSDRAALIYLGWASHFIVDLSLPHHASNWTSDEHQRQDDVGDVGAKSDLQGQIDWGAEMQSDVDTLLGQVTPNSRDSIDNFCAQNGLARSQVRDGALNWEGPYPAFLQVAHNAFAMRRPTADVSTINAADFQSYGKPILKNAILATITLLLCAPPTGSISPTCTGSPPCSGHGACHSGRCTCSDGYSGPDCSAYCATSSSCPDGVACTVNADCASRVCQGNVCIRPGCSPHCNPGASCGANADCGSNVCSSVTCAPPLCSPLCDPGLACGENADCASRVCQGNLCVPPGCSTHCNVGEFCGAGSDCRSGICTGGVCQPPNCFPFCGPAAACGTSVDCRAAPLTPLAGFEFVSVQGGATRQQEQVKYVSAGGDISELYFTQGATAWAHNDLTHNLGAPPIAVDSGLVAFESAFDQQQHVIYKAADGSNAIYEFVWSSATQSWAPPNNLNTRAPGAPTPKSGTPLAGYATDNQQLHVDYIADDGYPRELWYDTAHGPNWHPQDLYTAASVTTGKVRAVNIVGYVTPYNGQQHVVFVGEDRRIHEFMFDTAWHFDPNHGALSAAVPVFVPANSPFAAYVTTYANTHQQHVDFIAPGAFNALHVYEMRNAEGSGTWTSNDLNRYMTPGTVVSPTSALYGYASSDSQQHVYFVDANRHVEELAIGVGLPGWTPFDLTGRAVDTHGQQVAVVAGNGSHLAAYQTGWDGFKHVFFTTDNGDVYELYYANGRWNGNNLTQ